MDSTFYDLLEAELGGSGPREPPETNPPCTNPPSQIPNFNFLSNMEANRPWLLMDAIAVPDTQHPLPKFDPDNDVTPEDHIQKIYAFSQTNGCGT